MNQTNTVVIIMMIGIPGSGKTTLAREEFSAHAHVSMDKIRQMPAETRSEMLKRFEDEWLPYAASVSDDRKRECVMINDALDGSRDVVIDDTNVTMEERRIYFRLAQIHGATINAVYFKNTAQAYIRNAGREKKNGEKRLDDSILDKYCKCLDPPVYSEGFENIQVMC